MIGRVLKWMGIVLGSLIGLVVLAVLVLFGVASSRLNRNYDVDVTAVAIGTCRDCHGENLNGRPLPPCSMSRPPAT